MNSMSDLFHEDIPEAYIAKVAAVMHLASAEAVPVSLFLTTDDRLLATAERHAKSCESRENRHLQPMSTTIERRTPMELYRLGVAALDQALGPV